MLCYNLAGYPAQSVSGATLVREENRDKRRKKIGIGGEKTEA